jgi:hypothetical protein
MKFTALTWIALCACLCSLNLFAQDNVTDRATGISFPREVSFESKGKNYQLQATGVATRKKLIIKVYSIASYLQKDAQGGPSVLDQILSDENAKQLSMKYVRNVNVNQIQDAFRDSFKKVFQGQEGNPQLQGTIETFLRLFNQGVSSGDEYVFRWLPGGVVDVLINGNRVGGVTNAAFAKGLWEIWLGSNSIVRRDDLLSLTR